MLYYVYFILFSVGLFSEHVCMSVCVFKSNLCSFSLQVFEPSELERGHFTELDNEIRTTDMPERFQVNLHHCQSFFFSFVILTHSTAVCFQKLTFGM